MGGNKYDAYDEGYDDGFTKGYEAGKKEGAGYCQAEVDVLIANARRKGYEEGQYALDGKIRRLLDEELYS